jgi:enoyl-CoA hydratase/carnithine racemase
MLDPTSPDAARTEPQQPQQAQQVVRGHSGPARNGVNGRVNQTTRNLPDSVLVSQRGAVTLVRLSRPTKRNAIDAGMIADIERVFRCLPEGTRAVVLEGDGGHFCAGADLGLIAEADEPAAAVRMSRTWHCAFDQIESGNVPVIAVLHGAVIGGGLELAAAAHIRVAEQSTYYALPEGMRGIFVGGGGAVRIPRLIGTSRMIDMMLTGRTYSAEQGASLGFSQYVVADGQGLAKAIELAERIATNTTLSNFAVTQALPGITRSDPEAGLLMESLMMAVVASDGDSKMRVKDFLQKRAAEVSHPESGAASGAYREQNFDPPSQ